ncbi:MAG: hypothetical protein WAU32_16310 [Thermoanaerobaculia bacterium]|jgi:hypothetical protein
MTVGLGPATDSAAFRARGADIQIHSRAHIVSPEAPAPGEPLLPETFISN